MRLQQNFKFRWNCLALSFAIPCVGFIMLLVFAFGGTRNLNLRNFARSYFCFTIVMVILVVVLLVLFGGMLGIASMNL